MDPTQYPTSYSFSPNPISSYLFAPGIFYSAQDADSYLSNLDSDTRDYVLKHTDEFRTRRDIEDCITRLHTKSKE